MAVQLLAGADAVLERQRTVARARRDTLAAALRERLPAWRFALPAGGLSLWVELDAPRSTALAAVADRHGVRLAAGPRFGVDGAFERFVRIPYSLPEPVLDEAAARLAVAWRAVTRVRARGRGRRRPRWLLAWRTYVRVCCAVHGARCPPHHDPRPATHLRLAAPGDGPRRRRQPADRDDAVGDDDHLRRATRGTSCSAPASRTR